MISDYWESIQNNYPLLFKAVQIILHMPITIASAVRKNTNQFMRREMIKYLMKIYFTFRKL